MGILYMLQITQGKISENYPFIPGYYLATSRRLRLSPAMHCSPGMVLTPGAGRLATRTAAYYGTGLNAQRLGAPLAPAGLGGLGLGSLRCSPRRSLVVKEVGLSVKGSLGLDFTVS